MAETKSASNEAKPRRPRVMAIEFDDGAPSLPGYGPVGGLNAEINQGKSRSLEMEIGPEWTSVLCRYVADAGTTPPRLVQVSIPLAKLKRLDLDPEWRG